MVQKKTKDASRSSMNQRPPERFLEVRHRLLLNKRVFKTERLNGARPGIRTARQRRRRDARCSVRGLRLRCLRPKNREFGTFRRESKSLRNRKSRTSSTTSGSPSTRKRWRSILRTFGEAFKIQTTRWRAISWTSGKALDNHKILLSTWPIFGDTWRAGSESARLKKTSQPISGG